MDKEEKKIVIKPYGKQALISQLINLVVIFIISIIGLFFFLNSLHYFIYITFLLTIITKSIADIYYTDRIKKFEKAFDLWSISHFTLHIFFFALIFAFFSSFVISFIFVTTYSILWEVAEPRIMRKWNGIEESTINRITDIFIGSLFSSLFSIVLFPIIFQ